MKHVFRPGRVFQAIFLVIVLAAGFVSNANAVDRRSYQHGIRFIQNDKGHYWLLWSSSPGNPPQGEKRVILHDGTKCSYFTHDIYTSSFNVKDLSVEPQLLLALPEAQEPVDAAVAKDGSFAVTYEDGSESDANRCDGVIKQRVSIFSRFPQRPLSTQTVKVPGAHSGHVTSVGNDFIVVYAEGWIDGGGVSEAGTANDIYVDVFASSGLLTKHRPIAVDKGSPRDWWPLIAGSSRYALLVWQRFIENSRYARLMMAVYDPATNRLVKPVTELRDGLQYYHYDVQYLASINRFLIVGNSLASVSENNNLTVLTPRLFAYLLDESGNVVDQYDNEAYCSNCGSHPGVNLVREARPVIVSSAKESDSTVNVYYPVKPNSVVALQATTKQVSLQGMTGTRHFWSPLGADGINIGNNKILFANLSPLGVRLIEVPVGLIGNFKD